MGLGPGLRVGRIVCVLAAAAELPGAVREGVNLLDEDARIHASFLKDIAPLGRRGVVAGVRATF
jgi:hypothetical protein